MSKVMREQRDEMHNTFTSIRQKISQAQQEIRQQNEKTMRLQEDKVAADQRYSDAREKCKELKQIIEKRDRDLSDAENEIPSAKAKMRELESMFGENTHFTKSLERTRRELEDTKKSREESHGVAKVKSQECWQARQKLHKLEVDLEETEKKLEFSMRRIIVAREKIGLAQAQTVSSVSQNYPEMSEVELEAKFEELKHKVDNAKARRKAIEEKEQRLRIHNEEIEMQIKHYYEEMSKMFSGQRELASSKLI